MSYREILVAGALLGLACALLATGPGWDEWEAVGSAAVAVGGATRVHLTWVALSALTLAVLLAETARRRG